MKGSGGQLTKSFCSSSGEEKRHLSFETCNSRWGRPDLKRKQEGEVRRGGYYPEEKGGCRSLSAPKHQRDSKSDRRRDGKKPGPGEKKRNLEDVATLLWKKPSRRGKAP